jgi:hypothetical protein
VGAPSGFSLDSNSFLSSVGTIASAVGGGGAAAKVLRMWCDGWLGDEGVESGAATGNGDLGGGGGLRVSSSPEILGSVGSAAAMDLRVGVWCVDLRRADRPRLYGDGMLWRRVFEGGWLALVTCPDVRDAPRN